MIVSQCFGRVRSSYDVIQKLKKTLNNTQHHNIIANQQHQQILRARKGTAIYGLYGYVRCEGYGFQAVYSNSRVYKSERLGLELEWDIIFQETDQLVEEF